MTDGRFIAARLPLIVVWLTLAISAAQGGGIRIDRVEPPNWWTGMRHNTVQLMLHGTDIGKTAAHCNSPAVRVVRTFLPSNSSYMFVDLAIGDEATPGTYNVVLTRGDDSAVVHFPLYQRADTVGRHQGFDAADAVYLITPDRFANGDTTNESGMREGANRSHPYGRHGGDIQGIIDHLAYLKDLGVTTLWINPLIENDNPASSYHGYSATDLYRIDRRFGDNALYTTLVARAHEHGLKVIMDHVSNHCSINHPWIASLPMQEWLNGSVESHQLTRHYKRELNDVHSDSTLKRNVTEGWFTNDMPDLNQRCPYVATYLIQNTLWWIETTGLDGIREDTYPYTDQDFLSLWGKAILDEYPRFSIVGEVWINDPAFLAPYQAGSPLRKPFDSHLPSVTDFGLFDAFMKVFANRASIETIHDCLTKDILYPHPEALMTFLDNHDVRRIMSVTQGDTARTKLALALLLTLRGIPQLYYGTEIGMVGGRDHGSIRGDFPGGFMGDPHDAFTAAGRSPSQESMFEFVRRLLHLRREYPALARGTLLHRPVEKEVYVYARSLPGQRVLVVVNAGDSARTVDAASLMPLIPGAGALHGLMHGTVVDLERGASVRVKPQTVEIYVADEKK
jgi:glycosidase